VCSWAWESKEKESKRIFEKSQCLTVTAHVNIYLFSARNSQIYPTAISCSLGFLVAKRAKAKGRH
jgi:hypothetical protein